MGVSEAEQQSYGLGTSYRLIYPYECLNKFINSIQLKFGTFAQDGGETANV